MKIVGIIKKYKNPILLSIAGAAIWELLRRILSLFIAVAPTAGNSIFGILRDSMYYCAAMQSQISITNDISGVMSAMFIAVALIEVILVIKLKNRIAKIEKYDREASEKKDTERDYKKERSDKIDILFASKKKRDSRFLKRLLIFICVYFLIFFVFHVTYASIPAFMFEMFDRNITIITPYVDEHDIDILRSKWASMRTKADFDEINTYIMQVREENNIL